MPTCARKDISEGGVYQDFRAKLGLGMIEGLG